MHECFALKFFGEMTFCVTGSDQWGLLTLYLCLERLYLTWRLRDDKLRVHLSAAADVVVNDVVGLSLARQIGSSSHN